MKQIVPFKILIQIPKYLLKDDVIIDRIYRLDENYRINNELIYIHSELSTKEIYNQIKIDYEEEHIFVTIIKDSYGYQKTDFWKWFKQ